MAGSWLPVLLTLRTPSAVVLESPLLMLKTQQVFLPTSLQATPQQSLRLLGGPPSALDVMLVSEECPRSRDRRQHRVVRSQCECQPIRSAAFQSWKGSQRLLRYFRERDTELRDAVRKHLTRRPGTERPPPRQKMSPWLSAGRSSCMLAVRCSMGSWAPLCPARELWLTSPAPPGLPLP